jgi:hypothetical protein
MTPSLRDRAQAVLDAAETIASISAGPIGERWRRQQERDSAEFVMADAPAVIRDLLAALDAPPGEPVAWAVMCEGDKLPVEAYVHRSKAGAYVRALKPGAARVVPLYPGPAPSEAKERVPVPAGRLRGRVASLRRLPRRERGSSGAGSRDGARGAADMSKAGRFEIVRVGGETKIMERLAGGRDRSEYTVRRSWFGGLPAFSGDRTIGRSEASCIAHADSAAPSDAALALLDEARARLVGR